MRRVFERAFSDAARALAEFRGSEACLEALEAAGQLVVDVLKGGGRVLACGNGGSLADAMHFAEEWTGRFRNDRKPYAVMALAEPTHLTCVANDYGFEYVFSRQVEAFGRPGDALFVLSTTGNSPSIVKAAEAARSVGMTVVGFFGRGGGAALELCDIALLAPGETSDRIQELHMLALHALIEAAEAALGHGA